MATIVKEPFKSTFIHIPKTGGNSITQWLVKNTKCMVTKRNQHATLNEVIHGKHNQGPQDVNDLGFTFCVVRNPWDYMVSWYTFKVALCKTYIDIVNKNPELALRKKRKYNLEGNQAHLKYLEDLGFDGWVKKTGRKPQHYWAKDCDHVFKLENIHDDFKLIQEKANCFEPLETLNKTSERKKYKEYYTSQESIDIVAKKYSIDINSYGYDF